jgi:hypothetical protein
MRLKLLIAALTAALIAAAAGQVRAGGVVGSGTPGSCTAAALASAASGGGNVTFNCGANPHTITLTGQITLTSATTIDGGGKITLSGGNSTRLFFNNSGALLTVRNMTLRDGYSNDNIGGSALRGSYRSSFNVQNVQFINNVANASPAGGNAGGGAIWLHGGTLTVNGATFSGNQAINGSGGAIHALLSNVEINDATLVSNSSSGPGVGGAFHNDGTYEGGTNGYIIFRRVNFINNSANNTGGGAHVFLYPWQPGSYARMENVLFKGNSVSNNGLGAGLRFSNGPLTLRGALFMNNDADSQGGGIWFGDNASATVTNATFTGNRALLGGAMTFNTPNAITLNNVTVVGNVADWNGGGMFSGGSNVTLRNTIVAHNTARNQWNIDHNCGHTYTNGGNNLQFPNTTAGNDHRCAADIQIANPLLGALTNGGATFNDVMLPQPASPAKDRGNNATCANTDQRGVPRPIGAGCDIGAAETDGPAAGAFVITYPAWGTYVTGADARPTFRWTASIGTDLYEVILKDRTTRQTVYAAFLSAAQLNCAVECALPPSLYGFALQARHDYKLRVTAFGGSSNFVAKSGFGVLFPGYPQPITPHDGEIVFSQPTLTWSHVPGTDGYRVIIKYRGGRIYGKWGFFSPAQACSGNTCAFNLAALPGGGATQLIKGEFTWQILAVNGLGRVKSTARVMKMQ